MYIHIYMYIYIYIYIYLYILVCMYVCLLPLCNSNPMAASGGHPLEVPNVADNTQADDTLPSIMGRGGANCRITPGPHTHVFGGARPPPPRNPRNRPPRRPSQKPPLQAPPPPPRGLRPTVTCGGGGGVVGVQNRGVAPPVTLRGFSFMQHASQEVQSQGRCPSPRGPASA